MPTLVSPHKGVHQARGIRRGGRPQSPEGRLTFEYADLKGPSGSIMKQRLGRDEASWAGAYAKSQRVLTSKYRVEKCTGKEMKQEK